MLLLCLWINNLAFTQGTNEQRPPTTFPTPTTDSIPTFGQKGKPKADKGNSDAALQINDEPLDQIEYGGDTSIFHVQEGQIELFGEAYIKYLEYDIKADYILFDFEANEVTAQYGYDGFIGKQKPSFVYDGQNISAKRLRYNFNSSNGIVYDAIVQQNDLFIHGATTKFVKAENDSLQIDDIIYNRNALISTCNHDHPHWGIRTTKLKFVPDKLAVLGPAHMELAGIPIPLFLPYAFAPLFDFNAASSGLIFPEDPISMDRNLGLGIKGLGYYFALSDKMDLNVVGDIYTKGSWALRTTSSYYKRYKYRGNFGLGFSRQILESQGSLDKRRQDSYSFNLTHTQDSKAHPYRTIGGTLRFTVNDFDRRNVADANAQINSVISSNFRYDYKFSSKLFFSSSIEHSQNTLNRDISFSLPNMQLRLSRLSPFDNPSTTGSNDKWYEKIGVQYTGAFKNSFTTKDTLLFTQSTFDALSPGFTHDLSASASYNLLQYFSFNTNIDLDEYWYFKTVSREYETDTTGVDLVNVVNKLKTGFEQYRDINLTAGLSTSLYNTISSTKGWFRGFRHTVRPAVNLNYSPATRRYEKYIDENPLDEFYEPSAYNPFASLSDAKLFRSTSLDDGGLSMSYRIQNNFEAKIYSKKDSTEKKIKLLNNLNFGGNYNFNADSLNWSAITYSGTIRLFDNITTVSIAGSFDPYMESNNRRINKTVFSERNLPFRFEGFRVNISTQLTLKQLRDLFRSEEKERSARKQKTKNAEDEFFSWFSNFRIRHTFLYNLTQEDGVNESEIRTNSLTLSSGRIPLTQNWGFGIGNLSYDFKNKNFPVPQFNVFRELHCWDLSFSWFPSSDVFTFRIGVKAPPFSQYIKYQTGRDVFSGSRIR